jgi:hypothetical protein
MFKICTWEVWETIDIDRWKKEALPVRIFFLFGNTGLVRVTTVFTSQLLFFHRPSNEILPNAQLRVIHAHPVTPEAMRNFFYREKLVIFLTGYEAK